MVSQLGGRVWPAFWGAVGALSACLMAWAAYTDLGWGWFSVAVMLLMAPVPVVYAVWCHRETAPGEGIGDPSRFQFRVGRGVACALWALLGVGVLGWLTLGLEASLFAGTMLIWSLCLPELRVAHIVWTMRRRDAGENVVEARSGGEGGA